MRPKWIILALAVMAGIGMDAQQPGAPVQSARDVARIAQADFRAKLAAKDAFVVDVRDEVAFKSGHIPGAIHVPGKNVAGQATSIRRLAGPRLVVTYCSCAAEQSAAEAGLTLFQHGITRVAALVGGYPEWIHGGGPAETGTAVP